MKKSWGLIPKILKGTKTIESRWYKAKSKPWDRIKAGDNLYFKNAGEPVMIKTEVSKVLQYEIQDNNQALRIMTKHAEKDLGSPTISDEVKNYILDKEYAIFVFFDKIERIKPFKIDKTGFGAMSAWITVGDVDKIKNGNI